jgi:hypothetical protein
MTRTRKNKKKLKKGAMKRDRVEFESPRIPPWVHALSNYNRIIESVPVHDTSLQWDRASPYVPGFFPKDHNRGVRILPLGVMIYRRFFELASAFIDASPVEIDVHGYCCWTNRRAYTPLEWAIWSDALTPECAEMLWKAGLSATLIPRKEHDPQRLMQYMVNGRVATCLLMEDGIMAMVWCCRQAQGTQWLDIAAIVAERMRHVRVVQWIQARNRMELSEWTKVEEQD